jgi:hypothetical protein
VATKVQNYLEEKVVWEKSADPAYPYTARFEGERFTVRLNDFPDEHLYTLIVDGEEVADFDDWPEQWERR